MIKTINITNKHIFKVLGNLIPQSPICEELFKILFDTFPLFFTDGGGARADGLNAIAGMVGQQLQKFWCHTGDHH